MAPYGALEAKHFDQCILVQVGEKCCTGERGNESQVLVYREVGEARSPAAVIHVIFHPSFRRGKSSTMGASQKTSGPKSSPETLSPRNFNQQRRNSFPFSSFSSFSSFSYFSFLSSSAFAERMPDRMPDRIAKQVVRIYVR